MANKLRVYTSAGPRDFDASKVEIAPDGSMTLTQIENLGPQTDLATARTADHYRITLLAIIGPDGAIRAETVDDGEPEPAPLPTTLTGGMIRA